MTLRNKLVENILGKRENAGNSYKRQIPTVRQSSVNAFTSVKCTKLLGV